MAKRPAPAGRSTEIDVADDLFKEGPPAPPEPAAGPALERDKVPLVDLPPEGKKERPPLVEAVKEKKPAAAAKAVEDLEKEGEEEGGRGGKRPSALLYFGVPAAGAALILSMGWTFAFIIRQGLAPQAEAPKTVEQARVLPPREVPKAPTDARETMKVLIPATEGPALPSISPGGKGDETDAGKIALEEPFFIPLEGNRRSGKDKGPTVFLHLSLTLGVSNQAAMREVAGKRSSIREAVFDHFNRLAPQDLASVRGREQAKAALISRLSKEVVQGQVRSVYFEEFFTR